MSKSSIIEPFYRRPITFKTVAWVVLTPLVLCSVPALLWLAWGARPLNPLAEYNIATPTAPTPNAYYLYKEAQAEIDETLVAYYRKNRSYPSPILSFVAESETGDEAKKYPLAGKVRWLDQNRTSFKKFDQVLQTPYYLPTIRNTQPNDDRHEVTFLRWLAKYVYVECEVLGAQGKSAQAVNRALDIWKMGVDAGQGAPLIPALNGLAVEAIARQAIDGEIAHLNGAQAAQAAKRMEKLAASRVDWKAVLAEERAVSLVQLKSKLEETRRDQQREKETLAAIERGETVFYSDPKPATELRGPIINWIVRRSSNQLDKGYTALLNDAETPWPRRQTTPPALDAPTTKLITLLQKSRYNFGRADAFTQITLTRLALHAYRKDKGVYPPTLEAPVPSYLTKVPLDPFSEGQPLRYRREGKRYKLWSIGPDAHDDNARPALNPSPRTPKSRYFVSIDSMGDIVANVNR